MTNPVFWVGVLTLALIYANLAMVLNVESGWGGMWDLGIAGLLASGAYFYVILGVDDPDLGTRFVPGLPMWLAWPLAAVFTGLVALAIALPSLRLRREYFLITTLAFAEIIRQLAVIQADLTRGTVGFSGLDRPFDTVVEGRNYNYVLFGIVVFATLVMYLITRRIGMSSYGRTLRAARDNEALALALGKRVNRMRIKTFVLAGVLMGATVPLYLFYIRSLTPQLFAPGITFTVWTALVIGGLGSIRGGLVGAVVLIVFTEGVDLIEVDPQYINILVAIPSFMVGLLLVLVLRFRPDGLIAERNTFGARRRRRGRLFPSTAGAAAAAAAATDSDSSPAAGVPAPADPA